MTGERIFYVSALSPFGARLRLVAALTGANPGEITPPPGGSGSGEFKLISPFGQVPALVEDGAVMVESLALMEYLLETSGGSTLLPATPLLRARIRAIGMAHDYRVMTAMRPIFAMLRTPNPSPEDIAAIFTDVAAKLTTLAGMFDPQGFAIGGALSLADLTIAPFQVLTSFLAERFGIASPYAAIPRLAAWWEVVGAVPEVASEAERQGSAIKAVFG